MRLHFLIGPTAVGKTALALKWAKAHNAEILCADAPLVYRGMDIGTAKPTKVQQALVRHHGLDLVEVTQRFSVGDYAALAAVVVKDVSARGKNLLVAGGSGFYLRSFFVPVTDGVEISAEIVERVERIFATEGLPGLLKALGGLGPSEDLEGLDVRNPRRVMKALERCLAAGKSFQQVRRLYLAQEVPYADFEKKMVMLTREREDLFRRIGARVDAMLAERLIDEVKRLAAAGLAGNPQAASVIGYRETLEYLSGGLTEEELRGAIIKDTVALARKQRTFFKLLPVTKTLALEEGKTAEVEGLFE